MKDNFSLQSDQYRKFRPTYPRELYDFLMLHVEDKNTAWDCGTGNGQVAVELSKYFSHVYATDISERQLDNAVKKHNITYKVESAENTSFADSQFDLVTVAQAIHWFNFGEFYKEVKRTIKPGGMLAVIGYGLIQTDEDSDKIIQKFYNDIIGTYWDKERIYIDENYRTIPFPFHEIKAPELEIVLDWSFEQLKGFFESWSAVQHYIKANQHNPLDLVIEELEASWKTTVKKVKFPILLRVAKF